MLQHKGILCHWLLNTYVPRSEVLALPIDTVYDWTGQLLI